MRAVIDFTGPLGSDTGGATYATNLLAPWAEHGDDTLTALFSRGQVPSTLSGLECVTEVFAGLERVERQHGAYTSGLQSGLPSVATLSGVLDRQVALARFLRQRAFDVAYFAGNFVSPALPRGVPAVVHVHSLLHFHYPGQLSSARRRYRRWATFHAVRRADRIIAPSSSIADDLMRFVDARRTRIVVVPHGVDSELFRPGPIDRVTSGDFLFVSKPWDYKGFATVLRALRELTARSYERPGPQLRVADGGLSPTEVEEWLQLAGRLGIGDRVTFLGRLPHTELSREYQRASALVLPTSVESFGMAFLEAAACGCPVITGSGHGIDETIGAVAVQVPAHRHDKLAEAMEGCIVMTPRDRAETARRLRGWAERFPWARAASETRAVLAEVA